MRHAQHPSAVSLLFLAACDPLIRKFDVTPADLPCAGNVTVTWQGDAAGGHLVADKPVSPPLPDPAPDQGSQVVTVQQTTTFGYFYPGAGHREKTVVVHTNAPAKSLHFTGQCLSGSNTPAFTTASISAAEIPGFITNLQTDADWPVHVFINGQEIPLQAGGGPIGGVPGGVPAAGTYTIQVPGLAGQLVCKEAGGGGGPSGGGTVDVPPVNVIVTGSCGG
ncbi:MAG: hypothetical protein JO197_23360 [Acidobacteria bacterium]|nr:hypothetical protein [Acidobacteriota bacterium]MBV9477853.1 hypothetical protein [Acidobacteriota bacterium]